jgi:putative DNA primase/helicase
MTGAAAIASALGGARSGTWWRCVCPVHGSRTGSSATLALRDGGLGLIVKCFAGCNRDEVLAELCRRKLVDDDVGGGAVRPDPIELERQLAADERDRRRRSAVAFDFWEHETADPRGTATERYWIARDLAPPIPPTIRASRSWLRHPEGGSRPAMVALVEHVNFGPVAIHRTWLQIDGLKKASFREPRRSLGPVKGGAVRLATAAAELAVGEGIETCFSFQQATGIATWAALSDGGMTAIALPPRPLAATVYLLVDLDPAGERAAHTAAERLAREGRAVKLARPVAGNDFNDALREVRHAG